MPGTSTDPQAVRPEWTVRVAAPADVASLAALITLAYRVEDFFVDGDRTTDMDVRSKMDRGGFLVLEDGRGALAGCVYVELRGTRGYFGMLAIDPARQRQGLGARLVAAAEDHCRRAGCREMEIEVANLRRELPPYYRRLGYVECGTRPFPDPRRTRQSCHFILMARTLTRDDNEADPLST
jgi:GNAT superfamily N-acetyltransferase